MVRRNDQIVASVDSRLAVMDVRERAAAIAQLQDLIFGYELTDALDLATEGRDVTPKVCPHCGSVEFSKYGHVRGAQRYRCKGCSRTFVEKRPRNVITRSKLPRSTWMRFITCFVDGLTVKVCAARCGVSAPTAYRMRLCVMQAIADSMPEWHVGEGEEASLDETFVLESFKGNRKRCKDFEMPRKPYKRGRQSPHGPKRAKGITKADFLCVMSGVDGAGNAFFDVVTRGALGNEDCRSALEGRIGSGSVVSTDDHGSYACVGDMGATRKVFISVVPEGEINRVNTLHSALRFFLSPKRGVSSRRLPLYLAEFAWRWSSTRSDERREDTARRVIGKVANADAGEVAKSLSSAGYPFIEYWGTQQGQDERRRQLLAARQHVLNREMLKCAGDAEKEAELRMRQRKLDLDISESGIKPSSVGKGIYGGKAVADRTACTASVLRGGAKANVGAVRKFLM